MRTRNAVRFPPATPTLALLACAFFLRLFFAPFEGFKPDIQELVARDRYTAEHGVTRVADAVAGTNIPLYPPLAIYQGCLVSKIGAARLAKLQSQYPEVAEVWTRVRFKLLAITYDMLAGVAILLFLSRVADPPVALWGCAIFLFNPCVWMDSAWFGQIDAVHSFYMLLCVLCLGISWTGPRDGWLLAAWVMFGLSVCAKLQSILILPLLGWATLLRRDPAVIARSVLAGLLTALLFYSPYLVARRWDYLLHVFVKSFTFHNLTQVDAFNLWALLPSLPATNTFLGVSYAHIGEGLSLAALGWSVLLLTFLLKPDAAGADNVRKLTVAGAYGCAALFVLLTNMHERYISPAIPLLITAACLDRRLRWLAAGFSLTYALNILFVLRPMGATADELAIRNASNFALRVFGSLLNLGMVFWCTVRLPDLLRSPGTGPDAAERALGRAEQAA